MEGLFERIRSFFTSINKTTSRVRVLDSNGLIDESLYQGETIAPEVTAPAVAAPGVAVPAVTKKALTELK